MVFLEWARTYGLESARKQFGLSDHMVFVVRRGYVLGRCGRWVGSEPLGMGQSIESAKAKLRKAVGNCFASEETITEN